jgi:hypothetical protein
MSVLPRKDRSELKLLLKEKELNEMNEMLNLTNTKIDEMKIEQTNRENLAKPPVIVKVNAHAFDNLQQPQSIIPKLSAHPNPVIIPNRIRFSVAKEYAEYMKKMTGSVVFKGYDSNHNMCYVVSSLNWSDPVCNSYHAIPAYPGTYYLCPSKSPKMPSFKVSVLPDLSWQVEKCD